MFHVRNHTFFLDIFARLLDHSRHCDLRSLSFTRLGFCNSHSPSCLPPALIPLLAIPPLPKSSRRWRTRYRQTEIRTNLRVHRPTLGPWRRNQCTITFTKTASRVDITSTPRVRMWVCFVTAVILRCGGVHHLARFILSSTSVGNQGQHAITREYTNAPTSLPVSLFY